MAVRIRDNMALVGKSQFLGQPDIYFELHPHFPLRWIYPVSHESFSPPLLGIRSRMYQSDCLVAIITFMTLGTE